MQWFEWQKIAGSLIEAEDPFRKCPRTLGVENGQISICHTAELPQGFDKIIVLTRFDIHHGLCSTHWDTIGGKIRHLMRKGVLK